MCDEVFFVTIADGVSRYDSIQLAVNHMVLLVSSVRTSEAAEGLFPTTKGPSKCCA
jgi:hypothetical protein